MAGPDLSTGAAAMERILDRWPRDCRRIHPFNAWPEYVLPPGGGRSRRDKETAP